MIELKNISKDFGSGEKAVHAVRDVSLSIGSGEIFGIIGFSGAGKSTLVRCINLLERPSSGSVFVAGQDLTALSAKDLRAARKKIGMIFQHFNLMPSRTVAGNVAYPLKGSGLSKEDTATTATWPTSRTSPCSSLCSSSASSNLPADASSKRTRINVIPIQSLPTPLQKIILTEDISMKLKKFFALALAAATLALALTACGSKADDSADNSDANTDNQTGETVTVKLGVVGGIYDDLWASAKAALADEGIDLEIVQFSDYVTPNNALANGDIDLNAFQHRIYLQSEIESYGYAIQNIGNTFIIPLNLYSQKVSSVDELKDGDVVAIPDDLTNGARALKVLEAAGLIELDPNAAFNPTVDDITSYKVNITIEELKANTIPSVLPDVAAAVVNGNYALDFGLKTDEAIYKDSVLDVEEYWNLIAARTADIEDPDTAAIYEKVVEAFQSSATEDVFNNTFGGYFIAVGWDQDLINQ